jgi:hypothetical protein
VGTRAEPAGTPTGAAGVAPAGRAPGTPAGRVTVLGIRHHGPGSARALLAALVDLEPDLLLVEGPPEADGLVALAGSDALVPPVALLAYQDRPARAGGQTSEGSPPKAAFWPFAVFSPEWQAIRYATAHGVPLRFCDLPAAHQFAGAGTDEDPADHSEPTEPTEHPEPAEPVTIEPVTIEPVTTEPVVVEAVAAGREDPIAALARAAGYDDPERWWEDVIEHRRDGLPPFVAVAEAMTAVRDGEPVPPRERLREAYMRQTLRRALKEGHQRIAVVCGAWHVPALTGPLPPAAADAALLRGLPKVAVAMTWVPWTHGRLASWTGYGAGVTSPGWYHHLFSSDDHVIERWLVGVAGLLRAKDIPVSSAHVIEAVRLADALAVLRGRPLPGLAEITEATRAVLCDGDEGRLELVQRELVVGEKLGAVPDDTPAVPLARDLAAQQRRLTLPPSALVRDLDLDLRKPNDLARSHLLHRLRLLGVGWGERVDRRSGKGTFWESWQLQWRPEFAVDLVTASAYGTTVDSACVVKVVETAGDATLEQLTGLIEAILLADLPQAQPLVLRALQHRAAVDVDVLTLMAAVPALGRSLQYGDVRATRVDALVQVLTGIVTRIRLGLPQAATGLDDDATKLLRERLDGVHATVGMLGDRLGVRSDWLATLSGLVDRDDLPGLLGGRLLRLLRDEGVLDPDAVELRLSRALSVGTPPAQAAGIVEGFLSGGGLLLVHDESLLTLVDRWLAGLAPDTFTAVLPLLRRTFGAFAGPERRAVGQRVRHLGAGRPESGVDVLAGLDGDRVARVLPTLALLLGRPAADPNQAGDESAVQGEDAVEVAS